MFINLILSKISNLPARDLFIGALVCFGLVGIFSSLLVPAFITLLDLRAKAKLVATRDRFAEMQQTIINLKARVLTLQDELKTQQDNNLVLTGLVKEEMNHNRNWNAQALVAPRRTT